jgi:hypothetical protein
LPSGVFINRLLVAFVYLNLLASLPGGSDVGSLAVISRFGFPEAAPQLHGTQTSEKRKKSQRIFEIIHFERPNEVVLEEPV